MTTPLMTTSKPCGCGGSAATTPCDSPELRGLERTRFFARQLVMPDDLTQDQIYFREKMRRHNRMLHGWGVVCGACVFRGKTACEVVVDPGYILGPYGDEIVIESPVTIDVCKQGLGERDGCCGEELDPWCADTHTQCAEGPLYLAIRYRECQSRPIRSMSAACGCGCDDAACEYSRIRDSYAIKLLRELPPSYTTPMAPPPTDSLLPCRDGKARTCPPCPTDPWVILADLMVGRDCSVRTVDCLAHRRYVISYGTYYRICASAAPVGPGALQVALDEVRMHTLSTGNTMLVDLGAAGSASPRASVQITRADGSVATLPAGFAVNAGSTIDDVLKANGERQLFDPVTDRTYSLRSLFTAAKISPTARVDSTAGALGLLEGKTISIMTPGGSAAAAPAPSPPSSPAAPTPVATGALGKLLDRDGLDQLATEHGGDVARAGSLPATTLVGVAPTSALGKAMDAMSISDVAGATRDAFVAQVTGGMSKRQLPRATEQAEAVWKTAAQVAKLSKGPSK